MNPLDEILAQLGQLWGGQTLATFRDDATREFNGTSLTSLRTPNGPRRILMFCVTGEHELRKLERQWLASESAERFDDWAKVSLFEAAVRAMRAGGFAHDIEARSSRPAKPRVVIATSPDAVAKLEALFDLKL